MSLLIVEDNPMVLKALDFTFRHIFEEVHCAIDGMQGKEFYLEYRPDMVITDLMLPFISGLELTEYIREVEASYTMILVLSGMGMESTIQEAFDLGVDDYMVKPFVSSELVARIKRLRRYQVSSNILSSINI